MSVTVSYARCPRASLDAALKSEELIARLLGFDSFKATAPESLDLGKDWDALWFLLSGERRANRNLERPTEPIGQALLGAVPLHTPLDLGYGPQHLVPEGLVQEFSGLLGTIDQKYLRPLYDPAVLNRAKVYPGEWLNRGANFFDALFASFEALRAFYMRAAQAQHVVVVALS